MFIYCVAFVVIFEFSCLALQWGGVWEAQHKIAEIKLNKITHSVLTHSTAPINPCSSLGPLL